MNENGEIMMGLILLECLDMYLDKLNRGTRGRQD